MEFTAIIPTRGSIRKIFVEWQRQRAYDIGYDQVIVVDYEPQSDKMDLYDRIAKGIELSKHDWVSIIEDDDFYSLGYLDEIRKHIDGVNMIGINRTRYYHIFSTGHRLMVHPGRSSMFCTSFRRDIFNKLPKDNDRGYLDLAWWKYAEKNVKSKLIDKDIALGIKHGSVFGKTGGNGHHMFYETVDTSLNLLKKLVDDESFEFYRSLRDAYMNDFKLTITNYKRNR